ncbi:MAG: biopolymer transporter ExbD [Verrucomicrobiota bacterium]
MRTFRGQVDAAPFAGVFFLLVLFLLLNSSLIHVPGIRVELPQATELPGIDGPVLMVTVDRGGRFYYNHAVVPQEQLKPLLRADVLKQKQSPTLVVQADKSVPHDVIVGLGVLAREVGIKETLLATRPGVFAAEAAPAPQRSK